MESEKIEKLISRFEDEEDGLDMQDTHWLLVALIERTRGLEKSLKKLEALLNG